ncbi:MAG TPA: carbohydrate ABC transporter permease [Candidatus Limnocylindria bacterium]|nr:carbohydrate ABC transporter permease [Candidatus Limnocylindria bacterium]
MNRWRRTVTPSAIGKHAVLLGYTTIALFPIVLVVMNSFKARNAIFSDPVLPPTTSTFSTIGYDTIGKRGEFPTWLGNSVIVTGATLLLVVVLGAMAAFALSRYRFRGSRLLGLYLAVGIMIPIRLGTVSILSLIVGLGLGNSLLALILVYTAAGLPLAVFVLSNFFREVPRELEDAARVDGAGHFRIFAMVAQLARPAIAAVAILTMIPVWNDLWWPLILAPGRSTATLTLGTQQFLGQFVSDFNAVLAALTIAIIPMLVLYVLFNRQFIRGLMGGALK